MPLAMSGPTPTCEEDDSVSEFLDISRAHFHAPIERLVSAPLTNGAQAWTNHVCLAGCWGSTRPHEWERRTDAGLCVGTLTDCALTRGNLVALLQGHEYHLPQNDYYSYRRFVFEQKTVMNVIFPGGDFSDLN